MSYKSRQESDTITRDCFFQADMDRSGTITIYEFYNFLQVVFQRLGIYRQVNQGECQQLFRFYDDDRNGYLTPNELVDIVWDLYTADVQNDRVAIQQMLEKIIIEKYYNRPYNQFDTSNLYGHWGQTNTRGDWRNYRFNPYQMQKMQKFGYQFQKPVNSFQNIGMSSGYNQQQGGFVQQGGFMGQSQQQSSLGNFGQQGSYGNSNGSFGGNQMMQGGQGTMGGGVVVQVGGGGGTVVMLGGGGQQQQMGGMQMQIGGQQMGGMGVQMGGMGVQMGGMQTGGMGMQMGGMGMTQGMGMNQGMGMGMNQGMGGQPAYHTVNTNSQWGQQQMMVDPFCWQQIPSFGTDPQYIVLPSSSQLNQNQKMLDLNGFAQMTNYLQPQQIALVTPIRSRQVSQIQVWEAVKQVPYMLQQKGYNGVIHFKIFFAEFVNLLEQNQFKW